MIIKLRVSLVYNRKEYKTTNSCKTVFCVYLKHFWAKDWPRNTEDIFTQFLLTSSWYISNKFVFNNSPHFKFVYFIIVKKIKCSEIKNADLKEHLGNLIKVYA